MKPLVSIICITYNQAEYLSSCLDSIFSQQVDFQVELIIHDDASTDSTTEIISQYIKKCPFQIKTILQKENQYSKGIDIFSKYIYPKVEGKYIAICEGDDYWTDSRKLSIQIKMLEANQSFSATAHQSTVIYEKEKINKKRKLFVFFNLFINRSCKLSLIQKYSPIRHFENRTLSFRKWEILRCQQYISICR